MGPSQSGVRSRLQHRVIRDLVEPTGGQPICAFVRRRTFPEHDRLREAPGRPTDFEPFRSFDPCDWIIGRPVATPSGTATWPHSGRCNLSVSARFSGAQWRLGIYFRFSEILLDERVETAV